MMRQLVHGGRRVAVAAAQRAQEAHAAEQTRIVVDLRVADVGRHRIGAVLALEGDDTPRGLVERRLPGHLFPAVRRAPHRSAQPVRILMEILQAERLRTDVTAAERVLLIAADGEDLRAADADLDAADRLAEVAGAVVGVLRGAHHQIRTRCSGGR